MDSNPQKALQNINIVFESIETYKVDHKLTLKEFLKNYLPSLNDQIIDQDFSLKYNNNLMSKILLNNQIKDLFEKFHGNRIEITPTEETLEEIKNLIKTLINNQKTFENLKNNIKNYEAEQIINLFPNEEEFVSKISKKLKSLVLPLNEENQMFVIIIKKILKSFNEYESLFKDFTEDILDPLFKIKIQELFFIFTKLINHSLYEMNEFSYKYGKVFLDYSINSNDKKYIRTFGNLVMKTYEQFIKELMVYIKNSILEKIKVKNIYNETFLKTINSSYDFLFQQLERDLICFRVIRYLEKEDFRTAIKFLSCDEPINVNISEIEFNEIKFILSQFPGYLKIKNDLMKEKINADAIQESFHLCFERDVEIYSNYGIRMEDYVYAMALYQE